MQKFHFYQWFTHILYILSIEHARTYLCLCVSSEQKDRRLPLRAVYPPTPHPILALSGVAVEVAQRCFSLAKCNGKRRALIYWLFFCTPGHMHAHIQSEKHLLSSVFVLGSQTALSFPLNSSFLSIVHFLPSISALASLPLFTTQHFVSFRQFLLGDSL